LILVVTNLLEWPSVMPHAIRQAKVNGSTVLLAHVIRPSGSRGTNPSASLPFVLPSPTLRTVQTTLQQMIAAFEREGIPSESIILRGLPTEQVHSLVKSRGVDRVIVASGSTRGVERLLLGSAAEELATALDVPVCIVGPCAYPGRGHDAGPVRILAATLLEPASLLCAHFAVVYAKAHQGCLTLLHVLDSEKVHAQLRKNAILAAERELRVCLPRQEGDKCPADIAIREGDPATEILQAACSLSPDFIILGSPREATVSRILCDSVIHRVVREARCPVITIKPVASSVGFYCTNFSLQSTG
jgi:nucleotide-binding universal stress UspA family protein